MAQFYLSTDSTADLMREEITALACGFLPLTITLQRADDTEFLPDDFQSQEDYYRFYESLKDKEVNVSTSKNNTEIHREYFEKLAQQGHRNVLHFTISYGLANTIENAQEAGEIVKQTYPDFNLMVVESCTTTVGQGMLVRMAAKMRDQDKSMQETYDFCQEIKHRIQHFVMVDDLFHLKKGGRLSGAAATIGTMLQLKVVISFDREGKLKVVKKVTGGKRKCMNAILEESASFTFDKENPYPIIVHAGNPEFAQEFADAVKEKFNVTPEVRLIGPTIGCHVGPGAVAFAFIANEQRPY